MCNLTHPLLNAYDRSHSPSLPLVYSQGCSGDLYPAFDFSLTVSYERSMRGQSYFDWVVFFLVELVVQEFSLSFHALISMRRLI